MKKKLSLRVESIRTLSGPQLASVTGGLTLRSNVPYQCATYDHCSQTATAYCPSVTCSVSCYVDP